MQLLLKRCTHTSLHKPVPTKSLSLYINALFPLFMRVKRGPSYNKSGYGWRHTGVVRDGGTTALARCSRNICFWHIRDMKLENDEFCSHSLWPWNTLCSSIVWETFEMSLISGPDWSQCKPDDFTMASANIHPSIFARDSSHCIDVQKSDYNISWQNIWNGEACDKFPSKETGLTIFAKFMFQLFMMGEVSLVIGWIVDFATKKRQNMSTSDWGIPKF